MSGIRKTTAILSLAVGSVLIATGCDSDRPNKPVDSYPMTIGTTWDYSGVIFTINVESDSTAPINADTTHFESTVEIVRVATLFDSVQTYVFHGTLVQESQSTFHADHYYNVLEDGLYYYAYTRPPNSRAMPKLISSRPFVFQGRRFGSVREVFAAFSTPVRIAGQHDDTLTYENPPLRSLAYPLKVGSEWTYRNPSEPWHIAKRVTAFGATDVPAGSFQCYTVQWLLDVDGDGVWDGDIDLFDSISDIGLVKRSMFIRGIIRMNEMGDTLGIMNGGEELVLTSYQRP